MKNTSNIDTQLWDSIQQFDLDYPISEYGFSTRLAAENAWTQNFTQSAILEYKKFMYLAATSDAMVSPSEIVDVVWHQHLIFTQSYNALCQLLGKNIQHIPSTHHHGDLEKFRQAKDRTFEKYKEAFGDPPVAIWGYPGMIESLQLGKPKTGIKTGITIIIFISVFLLIPFYWLLKPLYVNIGNPDFLIGFCILIILSLLGLNYYNNEYLKRWIKQWPQDSFIWQLKPTELIYLSTNRLSTTLHGYINQMMERGNIVVNKTKKLEAAFTDWAASAEEYTIAKQLEYLGSVQYPELIQKLTKLPIFANTATTLDNFKKQVTNSKGFSNLFFVNLSVVLFWLLIGVTRFLTGFLRDKPIGYLGMVLFLLVIVSLIFLQNLSRKLFTDIISKEYKQTILPEKPEGDMDDWRYYLSGTSYFSAALIPLVNDVDNREGHSCGSDSSGSSCGGSSCGGGCGGCGGGD